MLLGSSACLYIWGQRGHGDVDENIGNMAGDFYAAWILNETSVKAWTRYFPVNDIIDIYRRTPKNSTANFTDVTLASLQECEVVFDLGLWALKTFGPLLFESWNRIKYHLPAVAELLLEQPLSGIDDMASLTVFEWGKCRKHALLLSTKWVHSGLGSSCATLYCVHTHCGVRALLATSA